MCQAPRQMFFKNLGQEEPPITDMIEIEGIPDGLTMQQAIEKGLIIETFEEVTWIQIHCEIIKKVVEVGPNDPQRSAIKNQDRDYYRPMEHNEFLQQVNINHMEYIPGMKIVRQVLRQEHLTVPVEVTEYVFLDTDLELPAELVFKH